MDFSTVMIILGCIIGLWILGRVFSIPLRAIMKLIGNSILGGLLIFVINLIGGNFGFHIGLNIGTSILVGILGIPRCDFIDNTKAFSLVYIIAGSYQLLQNIDKPQKKSWGLFFKNKYSGLK